MIDIKSVSRFRLSYVSGFDSALVTFESDVDLIAWRINRLGTSWDTGEVLEEESLDWARVANRTWDSLMSESWGQQAFIEAGISITDQIEASELQTGTQRINVYGKDRNGNWSLWQGDNLDWQSLLSKTWNLLQSETWGEQAYGG